MTMFGLQIAKLHTQYIWRTMTVLAAGIAMIALLPAFAGAGAADTAASPTLKKRVLRVPLPSLGDISVVSTTVTVKRKQRSAGKSAKSKTPRVGIRVRNRKLLPANVIVVSASRKLKKPKGKLVVSKTNVVFLVINRKTAGAARAKAAVGGIPDPEIVFDPLTNRTLAVIARPQYWANLIGSPAPPNPPACSRWGDYNSVSLTPGTDSTALFSSFPPSRLWSNVCGELTDTTYPGQDPFRSFIGATVTPPPVLPPPLAGALRICDHVGFPDELRILASANQSMSSFDVTITSGETIVSVFPNSPAGSTGTILAPQRASFSGVLPQNTESDFWVKLSANPTTATTVKVGYSISAAAPPILNFTSAFATCP